jgi:hypothetical protein
VGRTLLSGAFDLAAEVAIALAVVVEVWVGHSCPTPLTLGLKLIFPLASHGCDLLWLALWLPQHTHVRFLATAVVPCCLNVSS